MDRSPILPGPDEVRGSRCLSDSLYDVQGTGALALAGLYTAGRITGRKLSGQRILFVGAGEACLGIGSIVVAAMQREGWSEAEAKQRCLFVDSQGLVIAGRKDLPEHKRPFAQDRGPLPDLSAAIENFKPTALIGASGKGGLFTEPVLRAMARLNERPIVFALSNPMSKAECTAAQAYAWTDGRAVFASGSPFDPVPCGGRVHAPGQGNNSFVFPGVGLGLLICGARRVTDGCSSLPRRRLPRRFPKPIWNKAEFSGSRRACARWRLKSPLPWQRLPMSRVRRRSRDRWTCAEAARVMYEPRYA